MGLAKTIETSGGVPLSYWRVSGVQSMTNEATSIFVIGYTSQAKRAEEAQALEDGEPFDVYMDTRIIGVPYSNGMTVEQAYEYVKANVPEFEGAADVLEEGQSL